MHAFPQFYGKLGPKWFNALQKHGAPDIDTHNEQIKLRRACSAREDQWCSRRVSYTVIRKGTIRVQFGGYNSNRQ